MIDIKLLVAEQFPDFIREDFPNFVVFLQKYYEYLESTTKVPYTYDIDTSIEKFFDELKKQFAKDVPQFAKLSNKDFLIFAKEFYTARGTSDSYRFLIRAMFGKELDIDYPSNYIFRASDGQWNQNSSLLIKTLAPLDIESIASKSFTITMSTGVVLELAAEYGKKKLDVPNTYEIFVNQNNHRFIASISIGDIFAFGSHLGTVGSHVISSNILSHGAGFKVGRYYEILPTSEQIRFRVKKVNTGGSLKTIELLQFGSETVSDIYLSIVPDTIQATVRAFNYVPVGNEALIKLKVGSISKYPGYYGSIRGFLSDTIKIQSDYYQAFAYVLKLDEQLALYRDVMKKLVHPAGMAMYGQYDLSTEMAISITLEILSQLIRVELADEVLINDIITFKNTKVLYDSVSISDNVTWVLGKALTDIINTSDSGTIEIKPFQTYASQDYFLETGTSSYAIGNSIFTYF